MVISANPLMGSSQIDPGIMAALHAQEFRTRLGAVAELALLMEESTPSGPAPLAASCNAICSASGTSKYVGQ